MRKWLPRVDCDSSDSLDLFNKLFTANHPDLRFCLIINPSNPNQDPSLVVSLAAATQSVGSFHRDPLTFSCFYTLAPKSCFPFGLPTTMCGQRPCHVHPCVPNIGIMTLSKMDRILVKVMRSLFLEVFNQRLLYKDYNHATVILLFLNFLIP